MIRRLSTAFVVACLLVWPSLAFACAVCFDANEETRGAFLGTTIALSLLPLAVIGGFIYLLYRRARALDAEATDGAV